MWILLIDFYYNVFFFNLYFVFKFVYSMLKVRESRLKMSVFSVVNMVIGKNMYSVCVLYMKFVCFYNFFYYFMVFVKIVFRILFIWIVIFFLFSKII